MRPGADALACFAPGSVLHTEEEPARRLTVAGSRSVRDRGLIVAFEGVETRQAAEALRGAVVTISASARRPLEPDEYWPDELVGLLAVDRAGNVLGEVTGVEFGGQDRLVVTTPGGTEVLVPFVDALVGDPEEGRIPLTPPEGLFDPHPGLGG